MPGKRRYVPVFHDMYDDPRYEVVMADHAIRGAWLDLLIAADGMYPAPARMPAGMSAEVVDPLVRAGLVTKLSGNRYRMPDLDGLREGISETQRAKARKRWDRSDDLTDDAPDAAAMQWHSSGNASAMPPNQTRPNETNNQTRRNETRPDQGFPSFEEEEGITEAADELARLLSPSMKGGVA